MSDPILQFLAGVTGVLMGVLFGVSGFADAGHTDDLSKNQRVKNLLWLVGGATGVLLVDWKLLSPGDISPLERAILVGCYVGCALIAALITVVLISVSIFLTVKRRATDKPFFRGRAGELVLEYISYGYRFYRTRLDKMDQEAAKTADPAQSLGALGIALATVMATTALDRVHPDAAHRETFIDQVLAAMEDTVKLFGAGLPDLELRTNYMVRVSEGDLGAVVPIFASNPLGEYDGFLVLRRYRDGVAIAVGLPLEREERSTRLLPGAPTCVAQRAACHLHPRKLNFRSGVSGPIRSAVKDYFKDVPYVSVLSVPLIWNRAVVGVVNIESNHIDVVDKGPDMIKRIGHALAPFCVVLGELVARAEES